MKFLLLSLALATLCVYANSIYIEDAPVDKAALLKRCEELIQRGKDALAAHPRTKRNSLFVDEINDEMFKLRRLEELIHFCEAPGHLQEAKASLDSLEKQLNQSIKDLEEDKVGDDPINKEEIVKQADELIQKAQEAIAKNENNPKKHVDVEISKQEILIIQNLVEQIKKNDNPQALQILVENLKMHENILKNEIKDLNKPDNLGDHREELIQKAEKLIDETNAFLVRHRDSEHHHEKIPIIHELELVEILVEDMKMTRDEHRLRLMERALERHEGRLQEMMKHFEDHDHHRSTTQNPASSEQPSSTGAPTTSGKLAIPSTQDDKRDELIKRAEKLIDETNAFLVKHRDSEHHHEKIPIIHELEQLEILFEEMKMTNNEHRLHMMERDLERHERSLHEKMKHFEDHEHHRSTTETPATSEQPSTTGRPTTEQPSTTGRPTTEQPSTTGRPTTEQPSTTGRPTTEQPTTEQPTTEQPSTTGRPTTEQPTTEQKN